VLRRPSVCTELTQTPSPQLLRNALAWNPYLAPSALHSFVMSKVVCRLLLPVLTCLTTEPVSEPKAAALPDLLAPLLKHLPATYLQHDATSAPLLLLLQRMGAGQFGKQAQALAVNATKESA